MGVLARVGKAVAAGFGFGGAGGQPGKSVATEIADVVERWAPGAEKKAQIVADLESRFMAAQASARAHDAPQHTGAPLIDGLVNGVNRLIRPGVTIGLIGGLFGWWALPAPGTLDPLYWRFLEIVLIFWFGGRALFKDLPAMVKYLKR